MSVTIDWWDKIINVPKAYMTLIQSTPTEIRELDIDTLRYDLRALEASEEGVVFDYTHNHVAPVSVGGVTLARVVEIVNDYTITFEDGQYAVNIVGGNSNIGDNVNVNQVSVRSANSAGLITNTAIEFSSYSEGVTIDVTSGFAGTTFPIGTLQAPVNNLDDALLIAEVRGFGKLYIVGDFTFDATDNIDGFIIIGGDPQTDTITVTDGCSTVDTNFDNCKLTGTLNGAVTIKDSVLGALYEVQGIIIRSIIAGNLMLTGLGDVTFLECYSGVPGTGTPEIDMGGSGRGLGIRGYNGGIKITNLTGNENISIDLVSGQIILDSTVTAGTIVTRGIGTLTNNSTGTAVIHNDGLIKLGHGVY
jgi:hypothetical protein